jgi:hypothetical protein
MFSYKVPIFRQCLLKFLWCEKQISFELGLRLESEIAILLMEVLWFYLVDAEIAAAVRQTLV